MLNRSEQKVKLALFHEDLNNQLFQLTMNAQILEEIFQCQWQLDLGKIQKRKDEKHLCLLDLKILR